MELFSTFYCLFVWVNWKKPKKWCLNNVKIMQVYFAWRKLWLSMVSFLTLLSKNLPYNNPFYFVSIYLCKWEPPQNLKTQNPKIWRIFKQVFKFFKFSFLRIVQRFCNINYIQLFKCYFKIECWSFQLEFNILENFRLIFN